MRRILPLVAVSFVICTAANAQSALPHFEVKNECTKTASLGGDYSAFMFKSCMDLEQSTYNNLKVRWADLPPAVQKTCLRTATAFGGGSYFMLSSCVDLELRSMSDTEDFKF